MKRLGILGGVSPASTEIYYRALNEGIREQLGGFHSGNLLIHSFDFAEIAGLQQAEAWDEADAVMASAARGLEAAGVDGVLLACNTMHRCAPAMEDAMSVPFLHIADALGERLTADGRRKPALIGTLTTMEHPFIRARLADNYGIESVVPDKPVRDEIDHIIFEELCRHLIREESRARYIEITETMKAGGADAMILGCTEVGLLLTGSNCPLPVYDTALLHVEAAIAFMLG